MQKIILTPYNDVWPSLYMEEAAKLKALFGDKLHSIHHIGSTAIIGSDAKPTLDIMPLFYDIKDMEAFTSKLQAMRYHLKGELGIPGRGYCWKGEPDRTHNIHAFAIGNPAVHHHLIFRDYLNNYKPEVQRYSELQQELARQFPDNSESYSRAEQQYVESVLNKIHQDPVAATYDPLKDPIELVPYNSQWPLQAQREIEAIRAACKPGLIVDIQHMGSTAIKGVHAKPVIDILIGVKDIEVAQALIAPLEAMNYLYWADNPDITKMFFVKGMPPKGAGRTHHVHVMEYGGDKWDIKLLFRDHLNAHPQWAKRYQDLKLHLAEFYRYDREAYTVIKGKLVKEALADAGYEGKVSR